MSVRYAVIGAGWRSEFYLRIAALLPEMFSVSGIYIRNPEKRKLFSERYSVPVLESLEDLLKTDFDFVVSCVNKESITETAQMLSDKGVAVLTETPVMSDRLTGRIQVAEQFHFMPRNQGYKAVIDSGILGEVHQVQLSCCHDYHAASLIRFFLDITEELPKRTEIRLPDKVNRYNSRAGLIRPVEVDSEQKIVIFDFGGKTAVYDFNYEQYFSDIRDSGTVIRGTNGEIVDDTVTYLQDGRPCSFTIQRNAYGREENLDGFSLCYLTGNGKILYTNPFAYARFSDEEIAIATCLCRMKTYVDTGEPFYTPHEAYLDFRLFS